MTSLPTIDRSAQRPLLGLLVMHASPGVLERIGPDWDWIWIDAQHGDIDLREAVNLIRVTDLIQRPGLVRVPAHDPGWVGKILDSGAAGVIVPLVESVAEAKAMVRAAKFPPTGNRSYGGRRVIDRLTRDYYRTADRTTLLILQIESNAAVTQAEAMAGIEGVDGLFLGPDDLVIREGQDVNVPKNRDTIGKQTRAIAEACRRHGKLSVGIGVSEAGMQLAKDEQLNLVVGGGDVSFLVAGSKSSSQSMRTFFGLTGPAAAPAAATRTTY